MAPDYGATMASSRWTTRPSFTSKAPGTKEEIDALESLLQSQGMYGTIKKGAIDYSQVVELDLAGVTPSVAGPSAAGQDRDRQGKGEFTDLFSKSAAENGFSKKPEDLKKRIKTATGIESARAT